MKTKILPDFQICISVPLTLPQCNQLLWAKLSFPTNWLLQYKQSFDVMSTSWQFLCVWCVKDTHRETTPFFFRYMRKVRILKYSKSMYKTKLFLEGTNDLDWFLRIFPGFSKKTIVCVLCSLFSDLTSVY